MGLSRQFRYFYLFRVLRDFLPYLHPGIINWLKIINNDRDDDNRNRPEQLVEPLFFEFLTESHLILQ